MINKQKTTTMKNLKLKIRELQQSISMYHVGESGLSYEQISKKEDQLERLEDEFGKLERNEI